MAPPDRPHSGFPPNFNPDFYSKQAIAKRQAEAQAAAQEGHLLAEQQLRERGIIPGPPPPASNLPPMPRVGGRTPGVMPHGGSGPTPFPEPPAEVIAFLQQQQADAQRQAEEDAQHDADMRMLYEQGGMPAPVQPQQQQNPKYQAGPSGPGKPQGEPAFMRSHVAPAAKAAPGPKKVHPILSQLRIDLGLSGQEPIICRVGDHDWGFFPLTPEMTTLALRIASLMSEAERDLVGQYAAVCCSIVTLDGAPVWEVLGLVPEKGDDVSLPLLPSGRIRSRAAMGLLEELMSNTKLGLLQALVEAYNDEVDPAGLVKGHASYGVPRYHFSCPEEGCKFGLVRPRRFDSGQVELPYHCEFHGTAMVAEGEPMADAAEGHDPLVSSS